MKAIYQKMWKKRIFLNPYRRQMKRQIDKASQTQSLRGENEATNEPYYIHRKRGKGKESNVSQMTLHPQEIMLCYVLLPPRSLLFPSPLLSWNSPEHSVYTERLGNRCAARVQRQQRTERFHKRVQATPMNWTSFPYYKGGMCRFKLCKLGIWIGVDFK